MGKDIKVPVSKPVRIYLHTHTHTHYIYIYILYIYIIYICNMYMYIYVIYIYMCVIYMYIYIYVIYIWSNQVICSANQSCVQRSQNPRNFTKFSDSQHKISIVFTNENIFSLFNDSANKTKAFNLKVNCKELRLVFVHHVNTKCTYLRLFEQVDTLHFYIIFISIIILLSL